MHDYTGKTVFVAGGTTGINFAIAEGFAKAGARVFVVSRKDDNVRGAVEKLAAIAPQAAGTTADVRDLAAVEAAFAACMDKFGEIDVLISGAAGNFPIYANALTSNGFKAVVDIDLIGTFHVMRAAFPHLKKPGAVAISISAPQAVLAMEAQIHVCAAKAGVDMVTRVLAMEWGGHGVRVISVIPGPIDTEIWEKEDEPVAYDGPKHPPEIVTRAIFEVIEKRRREVMAPRRSLPLMTARFLRLVLPSLLRLGMRRMDPVPPELIRRARQRARDAAR